MPKAQSNQRWFPSRDQLDTPEKLEKAFRQMLTQHYSFVDRNEVAHASLEQPKNVTSTGIPPGSGPTDSMLLGLRVAPVDTQTLADGTKLTFVKAAGNFQFK